MLAAIRERRRRASLPASARRDRAVGDPALRGRDLDHRLEPIQAARAVAHDLDWRCPLRSAAAAKRGRDLVGADRNRAGIAGM